jgi:hypothetical protein
MVFAAISNRSTIEYRWLGVFDGKNIKEKKHLETLSSHSEVKQPDEQS